MHVTMGDLIAMGKQGQVNLIIHGCNCFCRMGRGFAKQVREQFPEAYEADQMTTPGDREKLGTCTFADHVINTNGDVVTIVNAYTQYHWNEPEGEVLIDYEAFRSCLRFVRRQFRWRNIGVPLIGAELARGNWATIERILAEEMVSMNLTIVHYKPD